MTTTREPAPIVLDDALWDRVTELTGGATAACFQCGICTAACPWGTVRGEALNVRQLVRRTQLGVQGDAADDDDVWLCTGCRQCEAYCPRGIDVPGVFRALRRAAWEDADVPAGLPTVLWNVHRDGNPWGQPPSKRMAWAGDLALPAFDPAVHELLLYIGCSASYDPRVQRVARALVTVLDAGGVEFGVLGEHEPCCGEAVMAVGHAPYLAEIVEQNRALFAERGVTDIVTISPHCYDTFASAYGDGAPRARHYTQLLAELVESGRLQVGALDGPARVTFQDPCVLGRGQGEFEAPRRLIAALGGAALVEMDDNREQALCCGGGGGRMWLETAPEERFGTLRVRQAGAVGADVLATACPACLACLEDGRKAAGLTEMRVLDVVELIAAAVAPAGAATGEERAG